MGLVGLLCEMPWSNAFDQSRMNFVEVTSILLPAILLVVLFVRMKIVAGKQVMLQSYEAKDVLMQEQKADHNYNGKLPFANFSVKKVYLGLILSLALFVIFMICRYHQ